MRPSSSLVKHLNFSKQSATDALETTLKKQFNKQRKQSVV